MEKIDYWIESLECIFEDIGRINVFSTEELKTIAESLIISADQESMAFGCSAAPNPLIQEISDLKKKHEVEMNIMEKRDEIFRKNVADRHGPYVNENDVYIENNTVYFDRI